ncbi:hypothetical protein BJ875DRAFT_488046 [Amylocarpus encephaloides]|uniref:F-box domain-containing protein n=1 Tax=Amylocarpus encephaloides TaxID=45428 RepID=A0A9P8C1Y0_9HELO|nr:hypothetical protein BJ875DRAFT_488046 [Amylocarpus encephaloides]
MSSNTALVEASAAVSAAPVSHFPYLHLPLEIQIMILEYLLILKATRMSGPVSRRSWHMVDSFQICKPPRHPTILNIDRMCKALRKDAFPIYYGKNYFYFINCFNLKNCLSQLPPDRRQMFKVIEIHWDAHRAAQESMELFATTCTNLTHLTLYVN